ncbi:MAG: hypothetical protein A2Y23_02710 [Clostridiales bacterium GWB2_37_7]|nr:MAG: hypothetical protein A2Y23_02710 [Clostridiales bacterium GWB2_37_7]
MKRVVSILLMFIFAATVIISADTADDKLKKQLEEQNKKIQQTQKAINQKESEKKTISKQVEELGNKLYQAENELDKVGGQLTTLESQIVVTKRDLDRATQDADSQKKILNKRVRVMYETGSVGYLSVILDSTSFGDFISRLDFLQKIMNYDVNLLSSMKQNRDNIAQKEAQFNNELNEKKRLIQELEDKKNEVASAKDERSKVLKSIEKDLKELDKLEDNLLKFAKEIEKQILAAQSNSKYVGGAMEWPVPTSKRITSPFGYRIHPVLKTKKFHSGMDIAAPTGTNIIASNDGTVIFSGYNGGYGYTVIIDHGGQLSTLYAHNSKLLVSKGDKVKRGQIISKMGSTGLTTGPNLHFEVRKNGQYVDPMPYFGK